MQNDHSAFALTRKEEKSVNLRLSIGAISSVQRHEILINESGAVQCEVVKVWIRKCRLGPAGFEIIGPMDRWLLNN